MSKTSLLFILWVFITVDFFASEDLYNSFEQGSNYEKSVSILNSEYLTQSDTLEYLLPRWENEQNSLETREKLLDWIDNHFQKNIASPDLKSLMDQITESNRQLLFQADSSGILFDAMGDPLIRSGDGDQIENDRNQWLQQIRTLKDSVISEWEHEAQSVAVEILRDLGPEYQNIAASQLSSNLNTYKKMVERETEQLINYSLQTFDYYRNEDNFSLRNKSEGETAQSIAEDLVNETKDEIEASSDILNSDKAQWQETLVEEASFSIEDWDASFKKEFEEGLKKWERAEQSLLSERISWELRAEEKYLETEKAWDDAFEYFAQNRVSWIKEINLQLEQGRQIWEEMEQDYMDQFQEISHEIEQAALEEEKKFTNRIHSALEVYRESVSLLQSASENIRFYEDKVNYYTSLIQSSVSKKSEVSNIVADLFSEKLQLESKIQLLEDRADEASYPFFIYIEITKLQKELESVNYDFQEKNSELNQVRLRIQSLKDQRNPYQAELNQWNSLKTSFVNQMTLAKNVLLDLQTTATGYDETVSVGTLDNEIERLSVLMENLKLQWDISEAVIAYSELNSSLRPTDAQTQEDFENAETALTEAEGAYQLAINDLNAAKEALVEKQSELESFSTTLEESRQSMIEAREKYEMSFAIYTNGDSDILESAIEEIQSEIKAWIEGDKDHQAERDRLYDDYLKVAEWESQYLYKEYLAKLLRDLQGQELMTEDDNEPNQSDLEESISIYSALQPDWDSEDLSLWQNQLISAGFSSDSESYNQLSDLYLQSFEPETGDISRLQLEAIIEAEIQENQALLDWNLSVQKWLGMNEWSQGDDAESLTQALQDEIVSEKNMYFFEKTNLIKSILEKIQLVAADPAADPEAINLQKYVQYLVDQNYEVTDDDLSSLTFLLDGFEDVSHLNITEEEFYISFKEDATTLSWFKIITGEKDGLPFSNILDLFLSEEKSSYTKALQQFDTWESLGRLSPVMQKEFIDQTILKGQTTDIEYLTMLENFTNLEEIKDFYRDFSRGEYLSSGIKNLTDRYISLIYNEEISNMGFSESESLEEITDLQNDIDQLSEGAGFTEENRELLINLGFQDEIAEIESYGISQQWLYYQESEFYDEELSSEENWLEFCIKNGNGDTDQTDIESFHFVQTDYSNLQTYTSYTGESVEEYISRMYPDAGYLENFALTNMITGSTVDITALAYSQMIQELQSRLEDLSEIYRLESQIADLVKREREENDDQGEQLLLEKQLMAALNTLHTDQEESSTQSRSLYMQIVQKSQYINTQKELLSKMKTDLALSRQSMANYKLNVVDVEFQKYQDAVEIFEDAKLDYDKAFSEMNDVSAEYLTAQKNLSEKYDAYQEANHLYQTAKEILDYAQCAYTPETMDILAIRNQRKQDYEKTVQALEILNKIKTEGNTDSDLDSELSDYIAQSENALSLKNVLNYASEQIQKQMGEQSLIINNSIREMNKQVAQVFDLSKIGHSINYNEDYLNQGMTDFTSYANSNLQTTIEKYFKSDNAKENFSKDIILWMQKMTQSGQDMNALMKTFSFALYYEADEILGKDGRDEQYRVDLFTNEVHKDLLKQKGTWLKGASIGYKGDLNKYLIGGYSSDEIARVFLDYNTGSVRKIYVTPQTWLKEHTKATYNAIKSNAQLNQLYSFYKFAMQAGCFNTSVKTAMNLDLSYYAWEYIDDKAHDEQRDHHHWYGYDSAGKKIKKKRKSLNSSAANYDGRLYLSAMTSAVSAGDRAYDSVRAARAEMRKLTGNGDATASKIINIINYATGINLNSDQKSLLTNSFPLVSSTFLSSNMLAINGLSGELDTVRSKIALDMQQRVAQLNQQRNIDYTELIGQYGSESFDGDSYEEKARLLYETPAYLPEDLNDLLMSKALNTKSYSNSGIYNNLTEYSNYLIQAFQNRLNVVKQSRYNELQIGLEKIYNQRDYWDDRTEELMAEGMQQWLNSTEKLIGQREKWRGNFKREYERKDQQWQIRYDTLEKNRNLWLENSSQRAIESGTQAVAMDMGLEADQMIGEVSFALIPDMTTSPGDVHDIVSDALDGTTIFSLLDSVKNLTSRTGQHNTILAAALPSLPETDSQILGLEEQQRELKEDLQKSLALAQAYKMLEIMKEKEESVDDSIESANESVDESVDSTLFAGGYSRQGKQYKRSVIIDSSVFGGIEMEDHQIEAYKYYTAPAFNHGVDLSINTLEKLNSVLIQARVNKAKDNMSRYLTIIFGPQKDEIADDGTGLDKNFLALLEAQENAFRNSAQYNKAYIDEEKGEQDTGKHTTTVGLFNYYVGYGPEMREDKPEKVKTEGYGEMGRIFKEFSIQQARLYRGLATVNTPTYNQKLWDDDADNDGSSDGFIGAPTARSLTDIAVSISASVFLGPGAALMVGMMDDALFTALDVQNGTDAGQAWGSFGKKAAISVTSNYIGGEFAGFQESKFIQDSVFASTGLKAAELTTNMTVSNGINAIDWDDGLAFNTDGFAESFQGQEAWAGVAAGTAGHAVTAGFQSGFFGEQFSIENQKNLQNAGWGSMALNVNSIGRFAGSVTQGATEYAMTGNTTVNLLNFDMFGITNKQKQIVSSGLLEFNLGKSNNVLEIGTGGIRADYSTLASVAEGIYVLDSEKRIQQQQASFAENVNKYTDNNYTADEMGRLNRMMRAYGDLSAKMQAAKMLSNETDLKIGQNTDGKAQTVMENGKRTVYLNNDLDMNNQNSVFDAIVTLSHEARRDGTAGSESSQTRETRRAVGSHVDSVDRLIKDFGTDFLFGNTEMFKDYVNYKKYGNEYVDGAYDSSADYWKLMDNGDLVKDNDGWLKDQNGNYKLDKDGNRIGAEGIETGLLNILNGGTSNKAYSEYSDAEIQAAQQLMINAGFTPSEVENFKDRMWNNGNDGKTIKANSTLAGFGDSVAPSVFMNGYDQVTDNILFGNNDAVTLNTIMGLPETSRDRFISYLSAKDSFWSGDYQIFSPETLENSRATGRFAPDSYYPDGQHKGIDVATKEGENLYSYFGGKVTRNYTSDSAGNSVVINHGFEFEGQFYSTGVQSQYMHMLEQSGYSVDDFVEPNKVVGQVSHTGDSQGNPGDHLHWQLMGDNAARTHDSSRWDMYQNRRNQFLNHIGGISSDKYSLYNTDDLNYWAGSSVEGGYSYNNFYYNTNFMLNNWGF